ncbi:cupin domain-containing protein [Emcibacter sp. SYSU 3D8]|uniref:cupin domain-containing protein n=1 Tax=Emcibacter sp. SYSU 3D8 TaxID=3133969 RepID=UPI0031FE53BD
MAMTVERNCFSGLEGVYDQLKARRLWPLTSVHEKALQREAPHWHPYNNHLFLLEGTISVFDEDAGIRYDLKGGDLCIVPAKTLHAAASDGPMVLMVCFDEPTPMSKIKANPAEEPR